VAFQTPPERHWRSYGNDPLPTGREAMDEPLAAFPSWFMRITVAQSRSSKSVASRPARCCAHWTAPRDWLDYC
jgi:hypothetical protein